MKNEFLSRLKEEIAGNEVPVKIAGTSLVVRRPTAAQYRAWIVEAEEIAKDELEPEREKLEARPASASERKEFAALAAVSGGMGECENAYQYRLLTRKLAVLSRRMVAEVLWNPDGTRPWESDEEREEIIDALAAVPGAEEAIQNALRTEKKSVPLTGSPKRSGKGPR